MRERRFSANLVLITFGAVLIIGGAVAMRMELTPYTTSRATATSRLMELAGGGTDYGLSTSSRELVLADCRGAMVSLAARVQTSAVRRALSEKCLATSDGLAAEQPTFSVAWLTGAVAAAQLEDWDGFKMRLARSLRSGPVEQWVAEMRVSIAEENYDRLTDELKAGNAADMLLLTHTDPGLLILGRLYLMSPASRERITAIVDGTDEVTREKFSRRVRLLSSGAVL